MTNVNLILHIYQKELIKKLSTTKSLRFNEMLIDDLESEHMNYHLKKLMSIGLVEKSGSRYSLTDSGKDYFNLLDEETDLIEKQPKTSIIINAVRLNSNNQVEHLLNRRLRQPYYGKVGRLSGKVKFGETMQQAAERELYEETGLKARSFVLEEIYRKMRKRKDGKWVQDVLFYIFLVTNFSGRLIKKTPYQENFWVTKNELENGDKYDLYRDLELDDRLTPEPLRFVENLSIAEGF